MRQIFENFRFKLRVYAALTAETDNIVPVVIPSRAIEDKRNLNSTCIRHCFHAERTGTVEIDAVRPGRVLFQRYSHSPSLRTGKCCHCGSVRDFAYNNGNRLYAYKIVLVWFKAMLLSCRIPLFLWVYFYRLYVCTHVKDAVTLLFHSIHILVCKEGDIVLML